MKTTSELQQLQTLDPLCVDKDTLVDIGSIQINMKLSREERIVDFIEQIKNPYLFKCGDLVVQSIFSDSGITLTERLKQYLRTV